MRKNRSFLQKHFMDVLESQTEDQKARSLALIALSKGNKRRGDCYVVLSARTTVSSDLNGQDLCHLMWFLSENVTGVDFLEGVPSEEELKNRTIELLVEGGKENLKLYEDTINARTAIMRRMYRAMDFANDEG